MKKNHVFEALARKHPQFNAQMQVLAQSEAVPSNTLAVRRTLPPRVIQALKDELLNLHRSEEGQDVLRQFGAVKFIETRDADYAPLHKMLHSLNAGVGSVQPPRP